MPTVDPINVTALAAVVLGCLTVLIPVAGLTLRFAIKPVAEALTRTRQTAGERESIELLERRMALLEQEVHSVTELRADIVRLLDETQFRKQLKSNT
jgi:Tfp pilus assembly protein PilN